MKRNIITHMEQMRSGSTAVSFSNNIAVAAPSAENSPGTVTNCDSVWCPFVEIEQRYTYAENHARELCNCNRSAVYQHNTVANCCVHQACRCSDNNPTSTIPSGMLNAEIFTDRSNVAVAKRKTAPSKFRDTDAVEDNRKIILTDVDLDHIHCFYPILD